MKVRIHLLACALVFGLIGLSNLYAAEAPVHGEKWLTPGGTELIYDSHTKQYSHPEIKVRVKKESQTRDKHTISTDPHTLVPLLKDDKGAVIPLHRPTPSLMSHLHKWRGTAFFVGGLVAYGGYSVASAYIPESLVTPLALAGLAGAGAKLLPNIFGKGMRKVFSDVNAIAEEQGLRGVVREVAKDAAGGIGQGIRNDLADPLVTRIGEELEPAVNKINGGIEKFSGRIKNIGYTLLGVGAGLIALWYGAKILNNYYETYVNKPRLDVVVKKASQNGAIGMLSRQIIVDEPTRDRLNLFLHTNLKVKQSIMSGNEEARYRTGLLWGPSGCGKRMFAQEMANFARMDYYEIPWSSFLKFKEGDAGRAIEEFFKHEVTKSINGAVIYIDNAQMLFSPLASGSMPSAHAMIRSALIENIEARSSRFLVIFGMTSKPTLAQDTALIVDDIVEISLPKLAERKRLLKYYRDLYFKGEGIQEETAQAVQRMLDDNALENLAKRLDKASASEIASFMNTLKIEAMLPTSEGLTPALVAQLIGRAEHRFEAAIS